MLQARVLHRHGGEGDARVHHLLAVEGLPAHVPVVARHDPLDPCRLDAHAKQPQNGVNGGPSSSNDDVLRRWHRDGWQEARRNDKGAQADLEGRRPRGGRLNPQVGRVNDLAICAHGPLHAGIQCGYDGVLPPGAHPEVPHTSGVDEVLDDVVVIHKNLASRSVVASCLSLLLCLVDALTGFLHLLQLPGAHAVVRALVVEPCKAVGIVPVTAGMVTLVNNDDADVLLFLGLLSCFHRGLCGGLSSLQKAVDKSKARGPGTNHQVVALEHLSAALLPRNAVADHGWQARVRRTGGLGSMICIAVSLTD
mmetsp:Transcript_18146/g.51468  ORF Transcript_18146/g.51468 Transcript_18146/m.51468 type:complete len:308 (-) Transcript_18146:20-943(-)